MYTTAGKNEMLDALGALITHVVAYQGDPAAAGVELDRQAVTFGAAANGVLTASNQPVLNILTGETVTHLAYVNATDTQLAIDDVTDEVYANDGTYTITSITMDIT